MLCRVIWQIIASGLRDHSTLIIWVKQSRTLHCRIWRNEILYVLQAIKRTCSVQCYIHLHMCSDCI